jgi:hypothetical protein
MLDLVRPLDVSQVLNSAPNKNAPVVWDEGFAARAITGQRTPANRLLRLICERIRKAAGHLKLSEPDIHRIFSRHNVFEGQMQVQTAEQGAEYILVETLHLVHGMIGKGALKLVFPQDLLGEGPQFRPDSSESGAIEVSPEDGATGWSDPALAERVVKNAMREFMTGETLSMSLKSHATGAPFAGSEGLMLCAMRNFDQSTGRYLLHPALEGDDQHAEADKELVELIMNQASEVLTRTHRIAYDKIVHAAETNSTLTARLDLQLPTNVVEGHLRALLQDDPEVVIGDEDMTARLSELLAAPGYVATECILAKAAARMQIEHSVLLPASRRTLRQLLVELSAGESPTAAQYRQLMNLFFGTGEVQQEEDQLYQHRESVLRALSLVLTERSLDDCGEAIALEFYLKTLLDNQRILLEVAVLKRLPSGHPLPLDWFKRSPLLSPDQERRLRILLPGPYITRDKVKEHFWEAVNILCEAKAELPRYTADPILQARKEVLDRATRAITAENALLPCTDRILFFTLPFAYECVTPKLGWSRANRSLSAVQRCVPKRWRQVVSCL